MNKDVIIPIPTIQKISLKLTCPFLRYILALIQSAREILKIVIKIAKIDTTRFSNKLTSLVLEIVLNNIKKYSRTLNLNFVGYDSPRFGVDLELEVEVVLVDPSLPHHEVPFDLPDVSQRTS